MLTAAKVAAGCLLISVLTACGQPDADAGKELVTDLGCLVCHEPSPGGSLGPPLTGIWATEVALDGGGSAVVDARYVAESVADPAAKIVAGFGPTMPAYRLTEEELLLVVAYVESLANGG